MAREHGTRSMYTGGCRCEPCTAANRAGERHRERMILYGRWEPFTDAEPVREHLRMLMAKGIGWKRAASLAGLSTSTVSRILYGWPGNPPRRQVRAATAEAILAVRPSLEAADPLARVDATGTRRRLQALAAAGWPLTRVAERLGWTRSNTTFVMRQKQVTAETALKVRALYDELWDKPCPAANANQREGIRRAVAHARRMGWPPPAGWDDDEIDDPRAKPRGRLRRDMEAAA